MLAKPPRCVIETIRQLLDIIPISENKLITEIISYRDSLWNVAPELTSTGSYYIPLQNILEKHIPIIDQEWKQKLLKVYNNEGI
jgi:hypothetical protein